MIVDRSDPGAQLDRLPENRFGLRVLLTLVIDESDGVEDRGGVGRELLSAQCERKGLLEIFRPRGIDPGEVVQDRRVLRTQALRLPVGDDGSIELALPLVDVPAKEVRWRQVRLQRDLR